VTCSWGGAVSPDGKLLAITNSGFGAHALHVVDLATEQEVATLPIPRSWNGLAWAPDSRRIDVAGGISNPQGDVYVFDRYDGGRWGLHSMFTLFGTDRDKTCIAGLALSPDGKILYVLNNSDNHLYIVEAATGAELARVEIGDHPVVARLSRDGHALYVANWGGSEVAVVDVADPRTPVIAARPQTGGHPNDLALSNDGRLFVSAGNADAVNVFDVATRQPIETIKTTLTPKAAYGSTPNAVALTPDNHTLFVANADNNDIGVIDVEVRGRSYVRGFIPSASYPTAVHVTQDGKRLIIGSGKGLGTHPNTVVTPIDPDAAVGFEYHGFQLAGILSIVDMPDAEQLAAYTKQVYANTPYHDDQLLAPSATTARRTAIQSYSRKGSTQATESVTRPPNGSLWESVLKKGLLVQGYYNMHPTLQDHTTVRYKEMRSIKGDRSSKPRDTDLAALFTEDFKEFEHTGKMPNLIIMSLGEDHTSGTTPGAFTPKASVASNDVALGQIVETVTNSSYWKSFAIFVIEDDAQNGPDSVDSHRTAGLVISPYVRRHQVDSTMYTTTSMLRTMELVLGVPPLTQHDAAATPMFESFTDTPTLTTYKALPARIDLTTRNTEHAYGARQSARMDWRTTTASTRTS
jgi:YVTN family beta-propeller protein